MLMYGKGITPENLDTRKTFADIAATALDYLGLPIDGLAGESFLNR